MLALHLQPMLNRLKYDLHITNPLNERIKQESPVAFEMAVCAGKVITRHYHKSVSDHELGYLALHFALALETFESSGQEECDHRLCQWRRQFADPVI